MYNDNNLCKFFLLLLTVDIFDTEENDSKYNIIVFTIILNRCIIIIIINNINLLGEQPDQPLVLNITEGKEQSKSVISIMVHFIYSFMLNVIRKTNKV